MELGGRSIDHIRVYGAADSAWIDGVLLELPGISVSIVLNYEDASLSWVLGSLFPQYEGQVEKSLYGVDKFFGILAFVWVMKNQYGYIDGVQIQVLRGGNHYNILQMMGSGGAIMLYSLSLEKPM